MTNNKYHILLYLSIISLLAYFNIFSHMSLSWFTTHDDINHYLASYGEWSDMAQQSGRVQHYINGLYAQVTLLFNNFTYYKWSHIVSMIILIILLGQLISKLYKNIFVGYAYSILIATLWQNSAGHNMIGSYPFYVAFTAISLLASTIFLINYIRDEKNYQLYISLLFWVLTIKGSELWILYLPFVVMIATTQSKEGRLLSKIKHSIYVSKWHTLLTLLNVAVYFIYKHYNGGSYDGSTVRIDSVVDFFNAWWSYTVGLFPGIKVYYMAEDLGVSYVVSLIDYKLLFVSIMVSLSLLSIRKKIIDMPMSNRAYIASVAIGAYALFIPNFLIALTHKYQVWALGSRIIDYLYSSLSYFAIVLFLLLIFISLRKMVIPYVSLTLAVVVLVLATGVNNYYIGDIYERYSRRFFMIEALLSSGYIQDGDSINAPTLYGGLIYNENTWRALIQKNYSKDITILKNGDANSSIKYIDSESNLDDISMFYAKNKSIKAIFVSAKKCNDVTPCYLVSTGKPMGNYIDIIASRFETGSPFIVSKIGSGKLFHDILIYQPDAEMREDQIVGIFNYDPSVLYRQTYYGIEFLDGLYSWERGYGKFAWSNGNVKVKLTNYDKVAKRYKLSLKLGTLKSRSVSFILNNALIKKVELAEGEQNRPVSMVFELPPGESELNITTDTPPAPPGTADKRLLGFSIGDIVYEVVE